MTIGEHSRTRRQRQWWMLALSPRAARSTTESKLPYPDADPKGKRFAYTPACVSETPTDSTDELFPEPTTEAIEVSLAPAESRGPRLFVMVQPFKEQPQTRVLSIENEVLIGRDPSAGIWLAGSLVSRRHVMVHACAQGFAIEDISSNGTLVNERPLHRARVEIARECMLLVGCNRVRLRRL